MISFRMGILKAMRKMTEKGKEMCVCFCVCRVVYILCVLKDIKKAATFECRNDFHFVFYIFAV